MTTKELSEICKVSEQAIRNYCNKHNVEKVRKESGQLSYVIDADMEKAIIQHYTKRLAIDTEKAGKETEKPRKETSNNLSLVIDHLNNQLSDKQNQIDDLRNMNDILKQQLIEKDKQIQSLTDALAKEQQTTLTLSDTLATTNTALTQAQTLHALSIQEHKQQQDTDEVQTDVTEQTEQVEKKHTEKKRGFFSKFKKK